MTQQRKKSGQPETAALVRAPKGVPTSAVRAQDPFLARELEKYPNPLPSREYILQMLAEQGVPTRLEPLAALLEIAPEELPQFERRLGAMIRDGQLMRNRRDAFILPARADLVRGRVEGHPDGYGFLIADDGSGDLFLGPREMKEVLHGDRALVRPSGVDFKGRREGKIVEVLERGNTRVVGRVVVNHGVASVAPENRRISQDILLARTGRTKLPEAGHVVTVELITQPTKNSPPVGKVVETLGGYADPGMEIEIALRKHDLPYEFSATAKAQTTRLPDTVRDKDLTARVDVRELPLVTIDGETARDFDDAVFAQRQGKGFRLVVAIADVSHYVTEGSALDRDAFDRGNSVYFPRRVIPMLPEKLSNGLCSLNPHVDRLCMVCDMAISLTGKIQRYRFYPAVMHSKARLTYNQVAAALYDKDAEARTLIGETLLPHLETLDELFRVLLKARSRRGAIDFETTETRMIFNDQGKIEKIVPETRNDAHRLIEECMLAANVCASEFLEFNEQPALYRVHAGPREAKLEKLRTFLTEFGLDLGGGDDPQASDFARLLDRVRGRPDFQLLQTVMLRSLSQAQYSPDNVGHFGLAYEAYTHFTSPIRRYPDLMVHRAIKEVLTRETGKRYLPKARGEMARDLDEAGAHCSATERRADEATRDVEAWLKCYYMKDRIGEEFAGSVSAVVPFGIFVALDDVFVEGLVHISDLGADYFHYDEARHELLGERTGQRFRLADRVRIQLVRADLETRKIDFRLLEATDRPTTRSGKTAGEAKRRRSDEDEPLSWRELAGLAAGKASVESAPSTKKAAGRQSPPRSGKAPASSKAGAKAGTGRAAPKAGSSKKSATAKSTKKKGARRG